MACNVPVSYTKSIEVKEGSDVLLAILISKGHQVQKLDIACMQKAIQSLYCHVVCNVPVSYTKSIEVKEGSDVLLAILISKGHQVQKLDIACMQKAIQSLYCHVVCNVPVSYTKSIEVKEGSDVLLALLISKGHQVQNLDMYAKSIIQLFGHCIATWYAMSRSLVKLKEIGTSYGCG